MNRRRLEIFIVCTILHVTSELALAQCGQTLNPGANVASAVASAAPGSTVCLNSGNYGAVLLSGISKSPRVTVRSTTPQGATISLSVFGVNGLNFQDLSVPFMHFTAGAPHVKNVSVLDCRFSPGQLVFRLFGNSNANILVDGNLFENFNATTGFEGRLEIIEGTNPVGVTVSNNIFRNTAAFGTACSDGIQVGSPGVTIGPGNTFDSLRQTGCGVHVDAIQGLPHVTNLTITGNYFSGNTIDIGNYDYEFNTVITHNIFDSGDPASNFPILLGGNGTIIRHNTFIDKPGVNVAAKAANPPAQNVSRLDNILVNSRFTDAGDRPGCQGGNCPIDYNLFSVAGYARGTNVIIGTPTFVGGSNPPTWAGYRLTPSSLGHGNASDGNDRGTNFFGSADPVQPGAPLNLQLTDLWWTRPVTLRHRGRSLPPQSWETGPPLPEDLELVVARRLCPLQKRARESPVS